MCSHVIVDGLGRSMCSRRCQCGICVSRNSLRYKALLVFVAATTYCWIEDDCIMWILSSRIIEFSRRSGWHGGCDVVAFANVVHPHL